MLQDIIDAALSEDESTATAALLALCRLGSIQVLNVASDLSRSPDEKQRALSADIIGQLANDDLADKRIAALAEQLRSETTPAVLGALARNCQYLPSDVLSDLLISARLHSDQQVRLGVVQGLSGQTPQRVLRYVLELISDPDENVSLWATHTVAIRFGDYDNPEIRDALFRKAETDVDSEEAVLGLAYRNDPRVNGLLAARLAELNPWEGVRLLEAAIIMSDPSLVDSLYRLKRSLETYGDLLESALKACSKR